MPHESDQAFAARETAAARVPTSFSLSPERDGGVCVLKASGELDLATREVLRAELERAEASDAERVVLDLSRLTFIDSTGLAVIVEAHRRSAENGRRLQLFPVSGQVHDVFQLTGLMRELTFVTST